MKRFLISFITFFTSIYSFAQCDSAVLSGKITDFGNKPIENVYIQIRSDSKTIAYEGFSDEMGNYKFMVKKGKYYSLAAVNKNEYPMWSKLPPADQRLEFWAWNPIIDKDITIDIKYHRMEIYAINAFSVQMAYPGYTVYCRPMSLTKWQANPSASDLCPDPEHLGVEVEINGEKVAINMKQKIKEFAGEDKFMYAYILHVSLPKNKNNENFDVFKLTLTDLNNGDKGEAFYYKEKENLKRQ